MRLLHKLRAGDGEIVLTPGTWVVGRTPNAGVYVPDALVSRRHALIRVGRDHCDILDLGSRNGTFVNGERVAGSQALKSGDKLLFGAFEYELVTMPVGPDDHYHTDDDETPLPARQIRERVASRARDHSFDDDLEETTFLSRLRDSVTQEFERPQELMGDPAPVDVKPHHKSRVLLLLQDQEWAQAISSVAGIHSNLAMEILEPADAIDAARKPGPGVLLLDLDLEEVDAERVLRAWNSGKDAERRVALISSSDNDPEGGMRAKQMGASGFVRKGKAAILCVAQIRFHIQLSGIVGSS